jgi:hypothetical protein
LIQDVTLKILFCLSNLFIPAVLSLIKNSKPGEVIIYTHQESIKQFFDNVELCRVDVYLRPDFAIRKNIGAIIKYFSRRSELEKFIIAMNPSEIYFFHCSFGGLENWLIRRISKNRKVIIFHSPIFNELPFKTRYSVSSLKLILSHLVLYQTRIVPLWTGDTFIPRISSSFFKNVRAQETKIKIDQWFIKSIVEKELIATDTEIVLLTGGAADLGHVEEAEYIEKINSLIECIGADNISVKQHPRFKETFGLEKGLSAVPNYIPANVLFSKFKIFIGYSTSTLTEAANNGLIAISLLDFFDATNQGRRQDFKNYLDQNLKCARKIHYVSDLNEVRQLMDFIAPNSRGEL